MKTLLLIMAMLVPLLVLAEDLGLEQPDAGDEERGAPVLPSPPEEGERGYRPGRPQRPERPRERLRFECRALNALDEAFEGESLSRERAARVSLNRCYFGSGEEELALSCEVVSCHPLRDLR